MSRKSTYMISKWLQCDAFHAYSWFNYKLDAFLVSLCISHHAIVIRWITFSIARCQIFMCNREIVILQFTFLKKIRDNMHNMLSSRICRKFVLYKEIHVNDCVYLLIFFPSGCLVLLYWNPCKWLCLAKYIFKTSMTIETSFKTGSINIILSLTLVLKDQIISEPLGLKYMKYKI